jgi:hypothetical protein
VPLVILRSLLIFLVCYWTMGLQGNFFYLAVEVFALQMVANSTALLIGSMLSSVEAVAQAAPLLFVPQILFAGFFVPMSRIPIFLRWVQYLCSLKYSLNLVLITELGDCKNHGTNPNPIYYEACDTILADNEVKRDQWYIYALVLLALFFGLRFLSLYFLIKRARNFY